MPLTRHFLFVPLSRTQKQEESKIAPASGKKKIETKTTTQSPSRTSEKRDQGREEERCRSLHPATDHASKAELPTHLSDSLGALNAYRQLSVKRISGCETALRTLGSSVTFPTQRVKLISASIQAFPQRSRCSTENQNCR